MQTLKLKRLLLQFYPDHPEEIKYFKQHFYRYLKTIKLIPPEYLSGKTVVDAGCIPGHMTSSLKALGAKEVIGLDYDPQRFGLGQKLQDRGLKIIKCHLGQEPLPLPANYADCVIFTEVIEHLSNNPISVLKELRRVLKTGGRLIVTTPNAGNFANLLRQAAGKSTDPRLLRLGEKPQQQHHREYRLSELAALLTGAGFKIKKTAYIPGTEWAIIKKSFPSPLPYLLSCIYALVPLAIPNVRSYLFVKAEKI